MYTLYCYIKEVCVYLRNARCTQVPPFRLQLSFMPQPLSVYVQQNCLPSALDEQTTVISFVYESPTYTYIQACKQIHTKRYMYTNSGDILLQARYVMPPLIAAATSC